VASSFEASAANIRRSMLLCPTIRVAGIKRWCASDVCLSDVRLSDAYIGLKSITERPRKTKTGTEVAHVTRDSDTTFKVTRSKVNLQWAGAYCGGLPHSLFELYTELFQSCTLAATDSETFQDKWPKAPVVYEVTTAWHAVWLFFLLPPVGRNAESDALLPYQIRIT